MRRRRWIGAADRALMARVARTDSVVLDQILPTVGRSANYSRLWFGVAGGLALTRTRRGRRAALRGVAALGLASATVNVVGKQLAGRARPAIDLVPLVRRLTVAPRTLSFPSGHSASAAAFATGVALENPWLGIPVGVLAAAVAGSRIAVGAHYPSDVVAGVGIGVAAGLLTQTWWPRSPLDPAAAKVGEAPALATGAGLVLVTNAASGNGSDAGLAELTGQLPDAELVRVGSDDDIAGEFDKAAARCTVLGVAGGDGTVNAAAGVAARRGLPLLVVPGGSLNHFARDIGVESVADAVAAVRAGTAVRVDLGLAGDHVFVNTASIGLYVDLVRFRERWEHRLGKWPAMAAGLVHVLRHAEPCAVEVDGRQRRLWMLFAGNCRYRPAGFAPTVRTRLDDGRLEVRIVDAGVRFARTRIVLGTLTRTLRWSGAYQATQRSGVEIAGQSGPLGLSVDGEVTAGPTVVRLGKAFGALTIYRPAGSADRSG
ncbi:MAG TPA: phosphatase PAP2 family protein [Pseudonocardiaceae bacterium]|jgi:undecaprenyl-diphosphatase|nr:phosphatase PAP2 family protein [Pseudonocardiaceae bacterium]